MDYSNTTRKELLVFCLQQNIKNISGKNKAMLIELLNNDAIIQLSPFLKWVGGKTQIITTVLDLFPKEITTYYEPFLGGGSVLLALLSAVKQERITVSGRITASDLNSGLIGLWKNIQLFPGEIIEATRILINEYEASKPDKNEDYFYTTRTRFNEELDKASISASALFLFLNKTCFRGMYRENSTGKFNVPYGFYKNPSIMNDENIMSVSELIKNVEFLNCDFLNVFETITHGDFVYLDPPYAPENTTSFTSYNKGGFDLETHARLFTACHLLNEKKVRILMSNADVELVKSAFSEYTMQSISCRRAINSKNPAARTNELLVSNY